MTLRRRTALFTEMQLPFCGSVRSPKVRSNGGFTLLEVMLAISILVMISAASMGFYQNMSSIRKTTLKQLDRLRRERLVMEGLTQELRCAFAMEDSFQSSLRMESDSIEFVTTTSQIASAWLKDDPQYAQSRGPSFDLRLVSYKLKTYKDKYGHIVNDGLVREEDRLVSANTVQASGNVLPDGSLHVPDINFIRFRYYDSSGPVGGGAVPTIPSVSGWHDTWSRPTLPDAIEVILGFEPLDEYEDAEEYLARRKFFRRVIHLPSGSVARL